MNVVHCHNIAGVASTLVNHQRRLGLDAVVIVRRRHVVGFEEKLSGRVSGLLEICRASVVHYHWTSWLERLPVFGLRNPDARLLKSLGKPVVVHFHGDDLRKNLARIRFKPDHTFVSTPDLLEYAQEAEWLPNPIDCETFHPAETRPSGPLRVGYYDPPGGGVYVPSDKIAHAISQLQQEGYHIEAAPARNLPRSAMPEYFRGLAIWIDKLEGGFYGIMACEAAASRVSVIASTSKISEYLREQVFHEFTGDLCGDLRYLFDNPAQDSKIAERGRTYVKNRHDATAIAKRTIDVYHSIM